jgi:hypothetical protein
MKLLRGLTSHQRLCGCRIGIYETFDGSIVEIVDTRAPNCRREAHRPGRVVYERRTFTLPDPGPWMSEVVGSMFGDTPAR